MNNKVFIISGAPGVGKTTLVKKLCSKFSKSAHISMDKLRRFVRGGYADPSKWSYETDIQYRIARQNAAFSAMNYLKHGYTVFIDDVFRDEWRQEFAGLLEGVELVLIYLTTDLNTAITRASRREYFLTNDNIRNHYNILEAQNTQEKGWEIFNTTNFSPDEISDRVYSFITKTNS